MRSLTDMLVAALGVDDTDAGDEVEAASSVSMTGGAMAAAVACVGSLVFVLVFSVVILAVRLMFLGGNHKIPIS